MREEKETSPEETTMRGYTISSLYSEINKDPDVLQKKDRAQFANTPLHEAAASGDTNLAIEIMNLMPSLGKKLNLEGLSPLHVALEHRQLDTAKALITFDKQLVRVKGKHGQTPLHCAAKIPNDVRVRDLLCRFLLDCPEAINDLNNRFQTAVHVALESRNLDAFEILVKWMVRSAREPTLARRDGRGNSAIHYAVKYCGLKEVETLVGLLTLNKKNSDGMTPLDIVDERLDLAEKVEIIRVLEKAGAKKAESLPRKPGPTEYLKSDLSPTEGLFRAYYFGTLDLSVDVRNVILVVAVLICTATYQGVLQPPGGLYQASADTNVTAVPHHSRRLLGLHPAGKMVMENRYYGYFMPANTFAFVLSTVIIIFVLPSRPFIIILQACLLFMCLSYLLALIFISGSDNVCPTTIFTLSWFAISFAIVSKILFYLVKALFDDEVWWLRRFGVGVANFCHRNSDRGFMKRAITFARRMRRQYKLLHDNADIRN